MEAEELSFGRWLQRRRLSLHLTQRQLASLAGCSAAMIRKLESDERRPSPGVSEGLADALQIPPDERRRFEHFARGKSTQAPSVETTLVPGTLRPLHAPNNLPVPTTPLIGRELELAAVQALLMQRDVRMVTLTGPGGVGKTRLALAVAATLRSGFADGTFVVDLAPITESTLVLPTIAETLEVREVAGRPLLASVQAHLRDKQILLVLDNFEQVLPAGLVVAGLLASASGLKVMVTSREPLRLKAELEYQVPPLPVPEYPVPEPSALLQYDSVKLFVERAQAAQAGFEVTNANAPAVAEICARLDGLPLAIELAAPRIKLLPPEALLPRLTSRLRLLTGGARDLPARHQTLCNTIDWSHSLLAATEQILFRRLAVFVGGCTIEAAEAVCDVGGDLAATFLDGMQSLMDKSLLQQREMPHSQPRLVMLETVREYASERLEASSEAERIRRRHANYFVTFAQGLEPEIRGSRRVSCLDRLESEHDNLRAAMQWALDHSEHALALRLAASLGPFWHAYSHLSEGRSWLGRALVSTDGAQPDTLARALYWAGMLAYKQGDYANAAALYEQSCEVSRVAGGPPSRVEPWLGLGWVVLDQGDTERATMLFEESLQLRRAKEDKRGVADALNALGWVARAQGNYMLAAIRWQESLSLFREVGDTLGVAASVHDLGLAEHAAGNHTRARALLDEALALQRNLRNVQGVARGLNCLGDVARSEGDDQRAEILYHESLALHREMGNEVGIAYALLNLSHIWLHRGDAPQATRLLIDSLARCKEFRDKEGMILCVAGLAGVAELEGEPMRAARLLGAVEARHQPMDPADRLEYERTLEWVRSQLDEETFASAWAEGHAMTLEEALTWAVENAAAV